MRSKMLPSQKHKDHCLFVCVLQLHVRKVKCLSLTFQGFLLCQCYCVVSLAPEAEVVEPANTHKHRFFKQYTNVLKSSGFVKSQQMSLQSLLGQKSIAPFQTARIRGQDPVKCKQKCGIQDPKSDRQNKHTLNRKKKVCAVEK